MDRKSIIVLVICGLLFLLWAELVPRLYPPPAPTRRTNQIITTASNVPLETVSSATNLPPKTPAAEKIPHGPEELLTTTNANARYTFSSYGGGLKLVELNAYPEAVSCRGKTPPGAQRLASLNTLAP